MGDQQITVGFDLPADNGSALTSHEVQVATDMAFTNIVRTDTGIDPTFTSYTVTGLTNGQEYYFRGRSINAGGAGPWTVPDGDDNGTPTAGAAVPGAVSNLTAVPGDTEVTLIWSAPAANGSPITGYRITRNGLTIPGSPTQPTFTDTGLVNGQPYSYQVYAVNAVGEGPASNQANATPFELTVTDPNPLPTWTTIRYAAPSQQGNGDGLTEANAMSVSAARNWLNAAGTPALAAVLCLPSSTYGDYIVDRNGAIVFNDATDRGANGWRGWGSADPNDRAVFRYTDNVYLQTMFGLGGNANRMAFFDMDMRNDSTGTINTNASDPEGAYKPRGCVTGVEGSSSGFHHLWVKGCRMWNFDSAGVATASNHANTNTGVPRNQADYCLTEDSQFYECGHLAPWGGSGVSYNTATPSPAVIDPVFQFPIDGVNKDWGKIIRRCWFFGCYQRVTSHGALITDGNAMTMDYFNYNSIYGPLGLTTYLDRPEYDRPAIIENNVCVGSGRDVANTLADPAGGYYIQFNTFYYPGQTYRHVLPNTNAGSTEAASMGGYNARFTNTRVRANQWVEDPTIAGDPAFHGNNHAHSYDASTGFVTPPTDVNYNTFENATFPKGGVLSSHANSQHGALGLAPPKTYFPPHNPGVDPLPVNPWLDIAACVAGMTSGAAAAKHAGLAIAPTDGVDIAWRPHDGETVGALVTGEAPPPPATGFKAVAQGLTGSGAVAMPAAAAVGDTIIYVATRDPAAPGTITAPQGATVANGAGGGNSTELLVWVDDAWNGTDTPGDFGDSGNFSERLIYVFDGTAASVTLGTETGSAPGPAPTWAAVTAPGAGSVIALASTYDVADAPYSRTDSTFVTNASQGNWVGVTGMSKAITAGGSQAPNPAGSFAGTGNMTTLLIAVQT